MSSSGSRNLRSVATLLILAGYCLVRASIYHRFPVDSVGSWFTRDTWMTVPRFVAFLMIFCVWAGWRTLAADWLPTGSFRAKVVGVVAIVIWCFYYSASGGPFFARNAIVIGTAGSIAVALFEEYAFRGPLLTEWSQRFSPAFGIVVSSVLFTVYHVQAQAVEFWVAIFLTGMMLAGLRCMGMGLGCLVIIHTIVDAAYFFFGSSPPPLASFHGAVLIIGLLICAVMAFPSRNERVAKFRL